MIAVTKSYLPDLSEYVKYLEGIWQRGHLTNHGPLIFELEEKLRAYLGVKHCFIVNNGTIALQIAFKALDLKGSVVTTPFSYVATTSTLVWEGLKPIFADIDPKTTCIDPDSVRDHLQDDTSAILATHVYGIPCDVHRLSALAQERGLKIVYDAAHAFGVRVNGVPMGQFGDISTLSFHATKLFHTIEGGAILTNDDALAHRISYMRNFGHRGQEAFDGVGINGKLSEFNAAMGLCLMPVVDQLIERRKVLSQLYDSLLLGHPSISRPAVAADIQYNYAYYPIMLSSEQQLLAVRDQLVAHQITPRRYFYPSLHTLPYVDKQELPVVESVAPRTLCLPLYPDLTEVEVKKIASIIVKNLT